MPVTVVTPPSPIVDVSTARAQLGIAAATSDQTVASWILAATQAIDGPTGWLNRAIGAQTLKVSLAGFPLDTTGCLSDPAAVSPISLPYPEIIGVIEVRYDDTTGVSQVLDSKNYVLAGALLIPAPSMSWPSANTAPGALQITYSAGYQTVPEIIKQAVLLAVSQMRSMFGRDPMMTTDTVYGVGSQQFAVGGAGAQNAVQSMLEPFRVIA